ncbi:MAG: tetratricopeptide repeat protein [Rhodospirillaceae bacterium]|nr:tetratricopeptide repeat protein [Rhodospirillaceae bacterium]
MTIHIRAFAAVLLLGGAVAMLPAADAMAAGSSSSTSSATTQADQRNIERGKQAIEARDWERAATFLERAAESSPRNADVFNLLAYSYRHLDRLDDAFENYGRALDLDPRHLGAHEYIGEAYLMVGDLAKAEEHLATLQDICASCEETEELAEAIAHFKEEGAAQ